MSESVTLSAPLSETGEPEKKHGWKNLLLPVHIVPDRLLYGDHDRLYFHEVCGHRSCTDCAG